MSRCREELNTFLSNPDSLSTEEIWQAAWNTRGKVDAEICRELDMTTKMCCTGSECAEAIEQEDEK